jgi:hypothetical protein
MAANALLDRGWGKAAQLVDVQGEIKQLVAVQLNVVSVADREPLTNLLTNTANPLKSLDADLSTEQVSAPGDAPAK